MQFTLNGDWNTLMVCILIGAAAATAIWIPLSIWIKNRAKMRLRIDLMQRLPITLDQIESDKEAQRAHHVVELKRLELKIAEHQEAEALAQAETAEAMGRIDKLNRRLEVLQIKLAARDKVKAIRRIDENLIKLGAAETSIDPEVA